MLEIGAPALLTTESTNSRYRHHSRSKCEFPHRVPDIKIIINLMHVKFIPDIDARNVGSMTEWGQLQFHGWTPPPKLPSVTIKSVEEEPKSAEEEPESVEEECESTEEKYEFAKDRRFYFKTSRSISKVGRKNAKFFRVLKGIGESRVAFKQ